MILSIIVPCFNCEKFLERCLESLIHQDLQPELYEIIVVDDGSYDNSKSICLDYINNYKNVVYFSQENSGIGSARNSGIRNAKGKYLMFVDSDDYIEYNSLSSFVDLMNNENLEVLHYNYTPLNSDLNPIKVTNNSTYSRRWEEDVTDGSVFLSQKLGWSCYVWLYIFTTSFLRNNQLFFKEQVIFEDVEWLVLTLLKVKKIKTVNIPIYFYIQNSESVTNKMSISNKNRIIDDKIKILNFLKGLSKEKSINEGVKKWCEGMIALTFMGLLSFTENELKGRKKEVIELLRKGFYPLKFYRFTTKQLRDTVLININPKIYCFLKSKNINYYFKLLRNSFI